MAEQPEKGRQGSTVKTIIVSASVLVLLAVTVYLGLWYIGIKGSQFVLGPKASAPYSHVE